MAKTLVLIRHAHRDTTRRELDNGLDDKGRDQAKAIKRFFNSRFGSYDTQKGLWLVSSPKVRCVETLQPAAKSIQRTVDIHPGLDEQSGKEPSGAFEKRVEGFLSEWANSNMELTVLCSHGDWLPLAIRRLLPGVHFEPKKGAWFELEWESGLATLKWCIPSFKSFYD